MRPGLGLVFTTSLFLSSSLPAEGFSTLIQLKHSQQPDLGLSPVHGTLLPDGRIMFFGSAQRDGNTVTTDGPFEAVLSVPPNLAPFPDTVHLDLENAPLECSEPGACVFSDNQGNSAFVFDMLFCSGHTLLDDGRLFTLSGTRFSAYLGADGQTATEMSGLNYNMTFTAATNSWNRVPGYLLSKGSGPKFGGGRWYGTSTRLHDGRILLTGGYDVVQKQYNNTPVPIPEAVELNISTEIYNPANGERELISAVGATPQAIFNPDYAHVFQLPWSAETGQDIVIFGEAATPVLMQANTALGGNFAEFNLPRPGPANGGNGASTLMLPLRLDPTASGYQTGAIMMVGGGRDSQLASADVFDFGGGGWTHRVALDSERHHPSTTILPDGKIFVVGGHPKANTQKPQNALLIDPQQNFSVVSSGQMATPRGYHTVSLLLPDGRVLVAGGRSGGATGINDEQPTMEIYSPPYLDSPTRPVIDYAPDVIKNQQAFPLLYHGTSNISEIVLIGLGSMTHSFDQNTRSIQVYAYNTTPGVVWGYNFFDNRATPPGMYMLFVLDENRIPSVAKIVQVTR
ncbi:MAG: galactose oxidase early set domain-containing protein [Gammaproteobacteria bacterium]|nr:galactose oxidase early set domain-containing protein [Gammaproteobacteria bacterium]MDH5803154.1 galactose oxidase early set domain-containing protein [Gammaproteobacteria bacterium]